MQKSTFSARAAASYLGFATSNPILDAIRSGELPAERRPGVTRNGRNTSSYLIGRANLEKWAATRGFEPTPAYESAQLGPVADVDGEVVPLPVEAPATVAPVEANVAAVVLADPAAADRLALLCELVRAAQWDAARVVIAVWDGRPLAAEAKAAPRARSARKANSGQKVAARKGDMRVS